MANEEAEDTNEGGAVTIICGANSEEVKQAVGMTVNEIREGMAETLNIPADAQALVSGDGVDDTYQLQAGDRLEFVREAGRKGC